MRRCLEEINEALFSADLQLHDPTVAPDGMLLRVEGKHVLYPAMRTLYRIFNRRSFSLGGRFYGAWWQQIPKKIRSQLLIDGEPTIEHDYPQLHPKMLYAQTGAYLKGDAYVLDGWPRHVVKVAFNILVNAGNHDSALRAIASEIGGEGAYARAASLIEAIKLRHPMITKMFHSDAGIRLQRRDADMAEAIMRRLVGLGIIVLPIHDSFITVARHEGALVEAMNIAWARCVGGDEIVISIAYDINDPQKERLERLERLELSEPPGVPSLFVALLPWSPLPDLFCGRPLPCRELETWSSGFMPLAVRAYLRDELKARGLRQSDVALSLGISRTQLVNILRGRFGASSRVTEDLKALAACLDSEIDGLALRQHRERQIERPAAEPPRQNRTMRPSGLLNVSTKFIEFTA
jgi:transcriptional regulator with XRE-family HTH domain